MLYQLSRVSNHQGSRFDKDLLHKQERKPLEPQVAKKLFLQVSLKPPYKTFMYSFQHTNFLQMICHMRIIYSQLLSGIDNRYMRRLIRTTERTPGKICHSL